mgnify:CR=1 FL=1
MLKWDTKMINVEGAFLRGGLENEIYMKMPEGLKFTKEDLINKKYLDGNHVCNIYNSMYGSVKSAKVWFKKMSDILIKRIGFKRCLADRCFLYKFNGEMIILIFIC